MVLSIMVWCCIVRIKMVRAMSIDMIGCMSEAFTFPGMHVREGQHAAEKDRKYGEKRQNLACHFSEHLRNT